MDLSDPASLPQRVQEALGAFGRVDILVNNAGISSRGSVLETDMAVDRRVMEVNFFGTVALTKGTYKALPLLSSYRGLGTKLGLGALTTAYYVLACCTPNPHAATAHV